MKSYVLLNRNGKTPEAFAPLTIIVRWRLRGSCQRSWTSSNENPLKTYVDEAFQQCKLGGAWSVADSEYPLSCKKLEELQSEHEREKKNDGKSSFVRTFNAGWEELTAHAVPRASEIEGTLKAKRACKDIVSQGCLTAHLRDAPHFPVIKGVLKALVAPVGQDRRGEQVVLQVSCNGENVVAPGSVALLPPQSAVFSPQSATLSSVLLLLLVPLS